MPPKRTDTSRTLSSGELLDEDGPGMFTLVSLAGKQRPGTSKLPLPPKYLRPFSGVVVAATMAYPVGGRNPNAATPCFGRDCVAGLIRCADVDTSCVGDDTMPPLSMRVHRR